MAITIKEILDKLSDKDRKLLEYCHENDIANFIEADGFKIGVYKDRIQGIGNVDLETGDWFVIKANNNV